MLLDNEAGCGTSIVLRPAEPRDADAIVRIFLESADYHTSLDPERYSVPSTETVMGHYREGQRNGSHVAEAAITVVAERGSEIVGFVDARLEQSPDPMHREMTYCNIAEVAVLRHFQCQGIGGLLISAAEDWGREQGAQFASLEYHAANARASSFYQQRMGYGVAAIIAIKRL